MTGALLILAALAGAQEFTEPPTAARLCERFVESTEPEKRFEALEEISKTPIVTPTDAAKCLEVYARFPDEDSRAAALAAVELMDARNVQLEPAFIAMIKTGDPDATVFGMRGAARLRSAEARPLVYKLAKKKFKKRRPTELTFASERDAWWTQYEALYALSRIDGDGAFDLVVKKTAQTPLAARILAVGYWERALPLFAEWSRGKAADRERALEGVATDVPTPALRATREKMLELVRDPKAERELRHQLALKLGVSSTPAEVEQLLAEHDKSPDEDTRLMLAAAIFSSRSRAAVPLLTRYLKENPQATMRSGARAQLRDTLPPAEYRPLVEWAAKNDPDPALRAEASKELSKLAP